MAMPRAFRAVLASIGLAGVSASAVLGQSRSDWQRAAVEHLGDLAAMLRAIDAAPALPHARLHANAADLHRALLDAGRYSALELTEAEGWTLVEAVYRKHGLPLTPALGGAVDIDDDPLPPAAPNFRAGTEFEPLRAVLLRWPFDWSSQRDEYAAMLEAIYDAGATAAVWTDSEAQRDSALSYLQSQGTPTSHVRWVVENTDSVWIRDYGPNFLYQTDGPGYGLVDFHYYPQRRNDDDTPLFVADALGVPVMDRQVNDVVFTEGGNINCDGLGVVVYSRRTFERNAGVPRATIDERIRTALNAHASIVPQDPSLDSTGHVDMFCKIIDEDTILVAQYDADERDHQTLEDGASLFASSVNGAGEPWEVVRIWQPDVYYVFFVIPVVRTYTNSLVVNDSVILPVYGLPYDAQAVALYESLYPGKRVYPINADVIIESGGAWHCVTMEFPDPANLD